MENDVEIRNSGATTKNVNGFISHSQYGEDLVLKDLLPSDGYFLEIGAYDPFDFSNTRFLVERNWSGCYVDGAPSSVDKFIKTYQDNEKITIVNSLIGDKNALVELYDSLGDAVSSTDVNFMNMWKSGGHAFRKIYTNMITIDTLKQILPPKIDFINVDIEGQSAIMSTMIDYDSFNCGVVCIEHDNKIDLLNNYFIPRGFKNHYHNGCNIIFVKA
jgi:hypothetical protein